MYFLHKTSKNNPKEFQLRGENALSYDEKNIPPHPPSKPEIPLPLTSDSLREVFAGSGDFLQHTVYVMGREDLKLHLFALDGMVNTANLIQGIMRPLTSNPVLKDTRDFQDLLSRVLHGGVYSFEVKLREKADDAALDLISGSCVLVFDELQRAVTFETKGFDFRGVSEPGGENVLKGSREGFIENIRMNTALLRRRIKSPNLVLEQFVVGRETKTTVAVAYLREFTNADLVQVVRDRVQSMDVDGVLSATVLEEALIEKPRPLFPTLLNTERVNKFCSGLLAGRVGLLVDGLPLGYLLPVGLSQHLKSEEDYGFHPVLGSFLTLMRYACFLISILLPGFFVAVVNFHPEMIPVELTLSLISSRAEVPFPMFLELLTMLLAFEVLLEAGVQLPREIGQAVSIVGGLILGSAAVEARIVSPIVVIVVAMTGVAGFVLPSQDLAGALRIWRLALTILGGVGGLFGLSIGGIALIFKLCGTESYGVPYLYPFVVSGSPKRILESVARLPTQDVKFRDPQLHPQNKRRRK